MKYNIYISKLFKKQYRKILKQGVEKNEIEKIINILAMGLNLPQKHNTHRLKGIFMGMYELHIRPDLLLIYSYHKNILILELVAIGSHNELFN